MEKVLLTVDEAAGQLAVSRWTMYRLMKERYVVSVQVGRAVNGSLRSLRFNTLRHSSTEWPDGRR